MVHLGGNRGCWSRSGLSGVEVVMAALIAALLSIPILALLFQERDTGQRSRFEYGAILAARDEMYETRLLIAAGAVPDELEHGWLPIDGSALDRLAPLVPASDPGYGYHLEQHRIETQLTLEPRSGTVRVARVLARWLDPTASSQEKANRAVVSLVFGFPEPK